MNFKLKFPLKFVVLNTIPMELFFNVQKVLQIF